MPHSGCSALHGVNPNLKKKKEIIPGEFMKISSVPILITTMALDVQWHISHIVSVRTNRVQNKTR